MCQILRDVYKFPITGTAIMDIPGIGAMRTKIIEEIRGLGASEKELALVTDEIAARTIIDRRSPKDVAWALLQEKEVETNGKKNECE